MMCLHLFVVYLSTIFRLFKFSGTLVRFLLKLMILALTFTKSLCQVLLRPVKASLTLWLYGNCFAKKAALFGSHRHTSQK